MKEETKERRNRGKRKTERKRVKFHRESSQFNTFVQSTLTISTFEKKIILILPS